ncbi:protein of unassigned function [Methylobacterium oryzae CBMB20]|uniref:Protein of unassigned function n=1 Tax=Methylobacterium oryzae CBMB20 TaxID=693986 RepID=A0A089QF16_9HYPH|nr:protein of unassigned function [Methylobacterium oryzae CBMB20]
MDFCKYDHHIIGNIQVYNQVTLHRRSGKIQIWQSNKNQIFTRQAPSITMPGSTLHFRPNVIWY